MCYCRARQRDVFQGGHLLVRSAFLFSPLLPFACEDMLVSRTCFSCSAAIPEDNNDWGSNWKELELDALSASEPTICSETASPLPVWDIYTFILLSCPLRCSHMQCLSPGAVHQTGPLVVMGWLVLAYLLSLAPSAALWQGEEHAWLLPW